jgi:hypothetical protein
LILPGVALAGLGALLIQKSKGMNQTIIFLKSSKKRHV